MIRQLHPTLKKCKCGFVGTRSQFYNHIDAEQFLDERRLFHRHGEVPLNIDDPVLLNKSNPQQ